MGRPALPVPLSEAGRTPLPTNTNHGGGLVEASAPPGSVCRPYLVYFWNPISFGADSGRMTSMESRVKVKRWSVYQGCRAGGALGSRKSHTGRKAGRRRGWQ